MGFGLFFEKTKCVLLQKKTFRFLKKISVFFATERNKEYSKKSCFFNPSLIIEVRNIISKKISKATLLVLGQDELTDYELTFQSITFHFEHYFSMSLTYIL